MKTVEPPVKQPVEEPAKQAEPQTDDFIIEFDDMPTGTQNNNSTKSKEDNRKNSFDLEDEYYDLDGF